MNSQHHGVIQWKEHWQAKFVPILKNLFVEILYSKKTHFQTRLPHPDLEKMDQVLQISLTKNCNQDHHLAIKLKDLLLDFLETQQA
jgi:hypothetical protein